MKKGLFLMLMVVAVVMVQHTSVQAQNLPHYKHIVKKLSSAKYQGRGYAKNGANKAGEYLVREYQKAGVDWIAFQPFNLDINTFPGKMSMSVDGKKQIPGVDFTMREFAPGIKGEFGLYYIDTANYDSEKIFSDLAKPENKNVFVVCDFLFSYKHPNDFHRMQSKDGCANAGLIYTWEEPLKFYKAYGEKVIDKPIIWVPYRFPKDAKRVKLNIENKFLKDYQCFNVIANISGQRHDSCYVFTAHYDHLGNLGKKVFYAGANDNASGSAAIVTLAEYYAKNRPEYDMYFLSFSGEDANLRGSEFFVDNPGVTAKYTIPLSQIKYLFNIDMIGDNNPVQYCEVSDEGMRGYTLLERINDEKQYFKALNRGELAGNSDHYPFAMRHVPCILFENEEGDAFKYYHTIYDNYKGAIFDSYEPIFRLVRDFIEQY
ncbi:MAG: M28 family peptidase [Bacteroidales bacterium]|nr:M28 family peptidase [Bacteroidales bacterium]